MNYEDRNWCLLIPRLFNFDSSVCLGIPSLIKKGMDENAAQAARVSRIRPVGFERVAIVALNAVVGAKPQEPSIVL
jgi:hypothetical protein